MLVAIGIMVATIGGIIGLYVITRMIELDSKDIGGGLVFFSRVTVVVALIGIVVLVFSCGDMMSSATSVSESLQNF